MLTVGVLYHPAALCSTHTIAVCYGRRYSINAFGIIICHNVGFLHCPSRLLGQVRRPQFVGWARKNPTFSIS